MATLTPITGTLGITRAKHLLQRFTFSANRATIQQFAALTAESAFDLLTATLPEPEPPIDPKTGATWLNPKPDPIINSEDFKLFDYYEAWHLEIMRKSGVNITERMVWFLHTHFPVQRSIVSSTAEVYYQNKLFRKYALGNFKELFIKMITDNAMLRYIDNNQNEVNSPNENFARELLELYSIGKGEQVGADDYTNYTELDVKIAARVLTGFKNDSEFANLDPDTQLPRAILKTDNNKRAYLHDAGIKTFSARFAEKSVTPNEIVSGYVTETAVFDELQQMISLIFEQPETAKFLVRKLYRQFVFYKISAEVETDIIVPLAELFATEKFELLPVLRKLILSQHFFDEDTALPENKRNGGLIKSPVDLVLGTLNFFDLTLPATYADLLTVYQSGIRKWLDDQGMNFYEPIDVAGYPAYTQVPTFNRFWITPNTLPYRYKLADNLLAGVKNESSVVLLALNTVEFVKKPGNISNPGNATELTAELISFLLSQPVPEARATYFRSFLSEQTDAADWTAAWNAYASGGSADTIKPKLDSLLRAILQSPEYQLF